MGDLDFGMAMVAARIASSELGKGQESQKNREMKDLPRNPGRGSDRRGTSLPGVKMEVINGELVLVPAAELPRTMRTKGWTLKREDGSVIRLDTGEVVQPPERRKSQVRR